MGGECSESSREPQWVHIAGYIKWVQLEVLMNLKVTQLALHANHSANTKRNGLKKKKKKKNFIHSSHISWYIEDHSFTNTYIEHD